MNRRFLALIAFVTLGLAAACGGDSSPTGPVTPLPTAPFSQTDLVAGTGTEATNGRRLTVHYTLWLFDPTKADNKGTQYQTSVGSTPFSFVLGVGGVIRGWDLGMVGMRVGGQRRLVVPPELAYGNTGSGSIPPGATLVFDVELLSLQ
jgi:FKBP-type peptidyl-prolyl cis-trans isomerase